MEDVESAKSKQYQLSSVKFDPTTLDEDQQRVYQNLKEVRGEKYALIWIFSMRTAVELHRAWNMTMYTSKILKAIKIKFGITMTWTLGVTELSFRVEDGGYELIRKVPYDYDSEYQNKFYKVALALVSEDIDVHQALIFQTEILEGKHTAKSGLFFRNYPGRLLVYPAEAYTCCIIFFKGGFEDAKVAALCGFVAGLIEWTCDTQFGEHKVLKDLLVGTSTGLISGLFWEFYSPTFCLYSIFMGVMYWFFYGTAFVIAILEIVSGELNTGVTRLIAVLIKTFVLSVGASLGMKLVIPNSYDSWITQRDNYCGLIDLETVWWRYPFYLLCCVAVLGQYRFPVTKCYRALIVMFVGYYIQSEILIRLDDANGENDYMDTIASNLVGCGCAVLVASALAEVVDSYVHYYNARILGRSVGKRNFLAAIVYKLTACSIYIYTALGLGRETDKLMISLHKKLKQQKKEIEDPSSAREALELTPEEEKIYLEALVFAESTHIWSILMPTVYQLVPGGTIAKLWFNTIFPPPLLEIPVTIPGTDITVNRYIIDPVETDVFGDLMAVAVSLALGLLGGFAVWDFLHKSFKKCFGGKTVEHKKDSLRS